jgi:hypothetical protein
VGFARAPFHTLPARSQIPRFRNCENIISIAAVEELTYRQSRLCRLLGNPVAFAVIALLANGKDLSTGEIAKLIGRSVPRTSNILGFCDLPNSYAIRPLETGVLTIDFAAVSDPENSYKLPRIINLVDHSVIADPNSPLTNTGYPFHTFQPFNRFAPFKVFTDRKEFARWFRERSDARDDTVEKRSWQGF